MLKRIVLDKPLGQTPLQAIDAWREAHPEYKDVAMSYAGRLDPMATGKLLLLFGEECKKQMKYLGLDKEYEVEFLLDLSTDTGDVLGLPSYALRETYPTTAELDAAYRSVTGTHEVPYPAFSSRPVAGKPLFMHALQGTLGTIEIPMHDETVHCIRALARSSLTRDELAARVHELLAHAPKNDGSSKTEGDDFRQTAIRTAWTELFPALPDRSFDLIRLRVTTGSATYMRTLANRIAASLGTTAFALSIRRSRIGRYLPVNRTGFWLREYR